MIFEISDGLEGRLQIAGQSVKIGDKIYSFTLKLDLTFVDNNKMPSITGEILAINFADAYTMI